MDLLELLLAHLTALRAPALEPFLRAWPAHAGIMPVLATTAAARPAPLPVLSYLPAMVAAVPPAGAALAQCLECRAPALTWRQTYRRGELDARFFDNYGYAELLAGSGAAGEEPIACGVLLLGPHTLYPSHRHIPQEIYVPLSGMASWRQGDGIWRMHPPGRVIHHASNELHAMQTGAQPLLAVYLWRGGDLSQPAQLAGSPPPTI